ncbi:MAG: response regulator transcription factor [Alphaproteobacteria bacterium]|nr:response regulator transcription factor [Alphaproteobacteria bacterium]
MAPMAQTYQKQNYALGNGLFLSQRQVGVLEQLGLGLSNKQIAHNLGVAEPTVKMHISALLRAFGVQNRVQILLRAKEKGFI